MLFPGPGNCPNSVRAIMFDYPSGKSGALLLLRKPAKAANDPVIL
jgi:hypothetical protein